MSSPTIWLLREWPGGSRYCPWNRASWPWVRKKMCCSKKKNFYLPVFDPLSFFLSFSCNPDQVSEEKAHQREDILKDQIRHLVSRLKARTSSEQKSSRLNCWKDTLDWKNGERKLKRQATANIPIFQRFHHLRSQRKQEIHYGWWKSQRYIAC